MAKNPFEVAAFEKVIKIINETLCKQDCYVSPDGNVYKREGDTYTVLTTIDIFLGMFLSPGCCNDLLMPSIFADYGTKLKGLLISPFQRLVHNRYPKTYMPDNIELQCLAKTARKEIKNISKITAKIQICS